MTDADSYSRPERFTERVAAKRYRAVLAKQGQCKFCIHRDRENTYFDMRVCQYGTARIYPQCQSDGRPFKFEVDSEAVQLAMQGVKDAA